MDEEGYVKIVGRKKDMLITGGFNVYPAEIEEYLFTHPKVQNVSVIGIPDDVMGEVAAAYIIPREGMTIDPQEIIDYCSGRDRQLQGAALCRTGRRSPDDPVRQDPEVPAPRVGLGIAEGRRHGEALSVAQVLMTAGASPKR